MNLPLRFPALVGVALVIATVSCGREHSAPAPLEVQVQGWWVTPTTGGCYCPSQPECSANDCTGYAVLGLLPDKRYLDGMVSVSSSSHMMSSIGVLSSGTYQVDGTTVVITQANLPDARLDASVIDSQLTLGPRVDVRAPASLAAALNQASANGKATWSRWPLAQ